MQKKWILYCGAAVLAVAAIILLAIYFGKSDSARPHFENSHFVITRADGLHYSFKAEVASNEEEQAYGLMFVRSMTDDQGMIFPYATPREVAFWMKNTLIPLDMLFVLPNGTIGRIAAETRPLDVMPISSEEPVIAVIEIKGGVAKQNGLAVGDKVESPAIITPQ